MKLRSRFPYCKTSYLFLLMGVVTGTMLSAQDAENGSWELIDDSKEIRVFARDVKHSGFKEFKGITLIQAPIDSIMKHITDASNFTHWMRHIENSYNLDSASPSVKHIYCEAKVPWPFSNRDMASKMETFRYNNDSIKVVLTGIADYIPQKKKVVRLEEARGQWVIHKNDEQSNWVEYQLYGKPGGHLPAWVLNMFMDQVPHRILLSLREMVESDCQ